MGLKISFRFLRYIFSLTLFEFEYDKIMSEEEKMKHLQSMGMIPMSPEEDNNVLKDKEGNRIVGFQGNTKESEDE